MKKIIISILFVILLFNSLDIDELSAYECLVEGDITGDDRLDARDFLVLKDWLLTGDNNACDICNADLNNDGEVNVLDLSGMVSIFSLLLTSVTPLSERVSIIFSKSFVERPRRLMLST